MRLQCTLIACYVLQLCTGNELAEVKRRVGLLKRVCRQRTLGAWKEWRTSMEQHRASWLANHLQLLQQDHAFLQSGLQRVQQVQQHAQELQTRLRDGMQAQRDQHQVLMSVHTGCALGSCHGMMAAALAHECSGVSVYRCLFDNTTAVNSRLSTRNIWCSASMSLPRGQMS